jgi:hypothetical protein
MINNVMRAPVGQNCLVQVKCLPGEIIFSLDMRIGVSDIHES